MLFLKVHDFYFDLPEELIAQYPLEDRSNSRLLRLNKDTGEIDHGVFKHIVKYLESGDTMVLNDTRVLPARLIGEKEGSGGKIEFLLLKRIEGDIWETLAKPGKKAIPGKRFSFGHGKLTAEILEVKEDGNRIIKFYYDGIFEQVLGELGQMPLPPYIKAALEDKERYQTVYSKESGSAAAPTAGLHFTKELLKEIEDKGVNIVYLTLHVGLGTFRPVKVENIEQHNMHAEHYELSEESARIINETKKKGGRIIAVGTTSCRTLETIGNNEGEVKAQSGWTDIFIYPGYKFKIVDALITNFHLPESTLIMLVSALAGQENIMKAYNMAVKEKYRFFSFGDAMFIN